MYDSEIWSLTGKIFSHFGPFFAFLLKKQNFEKKKKKKKKKNPGDIISLHLCTTNENHMMYGSLDIRCNVQSFLGTVFCTLDPPPLETWKIKTLIKLKKKFS